MLLPREIYTASQVRQLEASALVDGVTGYILMKRAGAAAFSVLRQRWPLARALVVVAGPGNNGGDGMVLARLAHQAGLDVRVMMVGDTAAARGEAREALADLRAAGLEPTPLDSVALVKADLVIDALLGIGAHAPLRPELQAAIEAINNAGRRVFALDLPSGLDPDTGHVMPAVRATATLAFIGLKQGMFLGEGPEHCGDLQFDALQVARAPIEPALRRLAYDVLAESMPPRPRRSHKSQFGRVLVVGGGKGMPGAVRLAGEAALRVGAGLVTVASLPAHLPAVTGQRPELMFCALHDPGDVAAAMTNADVVAVGPGLGRDAWAAAVLEAVLSAQIPNQRLVLDADALNMIAAMPEPPHRDDWVLTPHPGEAARMLGVPSAAVEEDRLGALKELRRRYGGIVVLKGAGTLLGATGQVPRLCGHGNPGMSVPGMGDVLTGAVAGFLVQSERPFEATAGAVYAHAVAGDHCARSGLRGVLALEVVQELRVVLAQLP
ncbi:MAG TPA: NAD(P)H-hydrate dehydratase [Steroidobacteraceae bacterium]|nr:NAD(P)H-hydrate dehydratase [Steroidobacteraceae bacterium]